MSAPYGDYVLRQYTVDCRKAEIRLLAEWPFEPRRRLTELVFTGVEAHHFEHDNFQTILGHITERPLETFLEQHAEEFKRGWHWSGWPSFWRDSLLDALTHLRGRSARAFEISSSLGLRGWVLAQHMDTRAIDEEEAYEHCT